MNLLLKIPIVIFHTIEKDSWNKRLLNSMQKGDCPPRLGVFRMVT
jgi:hypothetical protein